MTATAAPAKAKNDFPTVRIHHEGRDVNAHEIVCVQCEKAKDHVVCSNGTGRLPPEMLKKKFQQRGWYVRGRKRICPGCLAKKSAAQSGRPKVVVTESTPGQSDDWVKHQFEKPARHAAAAKQGTVDFPHVYTQEQARRMAAQHRAQDTAAMLKAMDGPETQEIIMKAEAPPAMTPADRRRVFREVDGQWDEGKSMYLGSATDQSIAEKLNVPRAWVATVRKEAFGDTDKNESMIHMLAEARDLRTKVEKYGNAALDAAAALERLTKSYDALIAKLEGKV